MIAPIVVGDLGLRTMDVFVKKFVKTKNMRKRASEDADEEEPSSGNPVVQTSKLSKRSDGKLSFSSGTAQVKRHHAEVDEDSSRARAAATFFYESDRTVQTQTDQRATATLETETAFDRDARAIRERVLKQAAEGMKGGATANDPKIYQGINAYTDHKAGFRKEHSIAAEKAGGAHGPLRASQYNRLSSRFDYQPDICKDYKETGYCGYGDSCKFLHDRGDYKSGWQMEKEWDEVQKKKKDRTALGFSVEEDAKGDDSDDEDELPFACFICRQPFRDPVMTQCKHYFCEHCALKHHSRNKLCFVCNKRTNGVFNTAHDILKRRKETAAAAAVGEVHRDGNLGVVVG